MKWKKARARHLPARAGLPDNRLIEQSCTTRLASAQIRRMFNFGKPKTTGDWIVHVAGAIVAIFLIWWMLRMYVL